jgi:hypothetical protein
MLTNAINGQFSNKKLPRGIRNNNPGNLRKSAVKWIGKVANPLDTAFESFGSMQAGIRAAVSNAHTHWNRGKNTVSELITIWAPPHENDTAKYVETVAKAAGISSQKEFVFGNNETTAKIMFAIFVHENGQIAKDYIKLSDVQSALAAKWPKSPAA